MAGRLVAAQQSRRAEHERAGAVAGDKRAVFPRSARNSITSWSSIIISESSRPPGTNSTSRLVGQSANGVEGITGSCFFQTRWISE